MGTSRSTDYRAVERGAGRRSGLSLALPLAFALLLAAGCGGGKEQLSKAAYEQRVRTVYADVQGAFEATRDASGPALAERIQAAQKRLREAADKLDSVDPPKAVAEENEELVEGMREYADDLDELRDAAERGDAETVERFNTEIANNEAVERIAEAAEEMKFKGYDLGRIAEE